jgi:hypothetical protein
MLRCAARNFGFNKTVPTKYTSQAKELMCLEFSRRLACFVGKQIPFCLRRNDRVVVALLVTLQQFRFQIDLGSGESDRYGTSLFC